MNVMFEYTASQLKTSGPILDAASRGVVRITRRGQNYVLLREAHLEEIVADAADPRPKTLEDMLVGHDAEATKVALREWLDDRPVGKETL